MKFAKDFKSPDPVPQEGIDRAIKLMQTGRMYRYNFYAEFHEDNPDLSVLGDENIASEVAKLEYEFSSYLGYKYAVAVNSCGSALFLALKAAGVKPQERVFTNGFTFTAVPSSIVHAGGIPVYIECNANYTIDIEDFKSKIAANPDVKYFILSHMRGHISEMDEIKAICEEAGIYLIEDCAHSLGAKWDGKHVGHHGKIACFSSQSYKMLNSGEGGFLVTNEPREAVYAILGAGCYENLYKKHIARPFDDDLFEELKPNVPGFSLRMNNLTAAVIRPQINKLERKVIEYKKRYDRLVGLLSSVDRIRIPNPPEKCDRAPSSIQFNLLNLTTKQLDKFLKETAVRGVKIQVFGRFDNARYFKNWRYSFAEIPDLERTDEIISFACDLRISLSFDFEDIDSLASIVKEVLQNIIDEADREKLLVSKA